jgi:hypothetical protein
MADLTFAPAAAAGIKPVPQTSLADMLGMARGVQEYQQAQQINPLSLQLKQLEAQRAQETTPSEIERQKSLSRQQLTSEEGSNLELQQKYAGAAKAATSGLMVSPYFQPEPNKKYEPEKMLHELDTVERVLSAQGVKKHPHGAMDQLREIIKTDPSKAFGYLQTLSAGELSPEGRMTLGLPEKVAVTPGQAFGTRNPVTGKIEMAPLGAAPQAGQPAPMAAPTNMPLKYPVRSGAQLFTAEPSEIADRDAGIAYRQKLEAAQRTLPTSIRNAREVEKQATDMMKDLYFPSGGLRGNIEQKLRMAVESEKYDMLQKDLANMALTNNQTLGNAGDTVAGLNMREVANGSIKVPLPVLIQISRRVQADQTNIDMQTNGARKFVQKYGDNNMSAFNEAWNNNSKNTEVFEAMNIYKNETDPVKRVKEIDKLLGTNRKKREEFFQQYQNLKKLSETGSL